MRIGGSIVGPQANGLTRQVRIFVLELSRGGIVQMVIKPINPDSSPDSGKNFSFKNKFIVMQQSQVSFSIRYVTCYSNITLMHIEENLT